MERPADEAERLAAIRRYDILDTPPDGAFDRITALAARLCDVPISTISIVDEDRIWFKSSHGVDVDEIGRDPGLCASAIIRDVPHIVTNAIEDPRTLDNPLVRGELGLRFYLGIPLVTSDGYKLGTLNVIDAEPREPTPGEIDTLSDLAAVVVDELELRLAARRTIELEAAREAAELRESLLAGISHEMRTPIAVLNGLLSIEPSEDLDDDTKQTMMRRRVRQLDRLINQYLDFIRIEAGRSPDVTIEPVNLAELVQEAADVFSPEAPIELEIDEDTPTVLADRNRARQIVLELINNAVRFSPAASPVTVLLHHDERARVGVTVVDRGRGIYAADRDDVFGKLHRGRDSTGSGIGLYVARALADAQSGQIEVESVPGEGSRFTLFLPAVTA